jgi:hypothetical protein
MPIAFLAQMRLRAGAKSSGIPINTSANRCIPLNTQCKNTISAEIFILFVSFCIKMQQTKKHFTRLHPLEILASTLL